MIIGEGLGSSIARPRELLSLVRDMRAKGSQGCCFANKAAQGNDLGSFKKIPILGPLLRNSDFVGWVSASIRIFLLSPGDSNILQGLSPSAQPAS